MPFPSTNTSASIGGNGHGAIASQQTISAAPSERCGSGCGRVPVGMSLPTRRAWASARTVHKSGDFEAIVVSDGHFVLPTGFLVAPDSPPAEREAALKAAGQSGDRLQLVNNVVVIRHQSDLILVDAGTGPRHQPTAGKLAENLRAAGIQPAAITTVVLTHGHPDHLWGVLDANDNPIYPNATYAVSALELNVGPTRM